LLARRKHGDRNANGDLRSVRPRLRLRDDEIELFPKGDGSSDMTLQSSDLAGDVGLDQSQGGVLSDMAQPYLPSSCECRFVRCRIDPDCQSAIGAASICDATFTCTGAVGSCTQATGCAGGAAWLCAQSATSRATCAQ
jgi:hypothetical protein